MAHYQMKTHPERDMRSISHAISLSALGWDILPHIEEEDALDNLALLFITKQSTNLKTNS